MSESESDNLGQFRIIQAEHRYRSALRWLADFDSATWPEVRMFLSSYCPPGPAFEAFLIRFHGWERSKKRPVEVEEDGRTLEDELRLAMAEFRKGLDTLSLIGSVISPLDEQGALPWRMIREIAMDPFSGAGGFVTITGDPRTGKTALACLLMEQWLRLRPDGLVLTNIILQHAVDNVVETPGVSVLRSQVFRCIKEGRKWLWVFDDAGLEWVKQRAMRGTSIDLELFARIVPKHGGSLVYIDQREGGVPTTISEFAGENRFRCLRKGGGFAITRLPEYSGGVRDIPLPLTPFISEARSAFLMDADIGDMIGAIPRPKAAPEVA